MQYNYYSINVYSIIRSVFLNFLSAFLILVKVRGTVPAGH